MPPAADPKQPSYDALTALLKQSTAAANDKNNTPAAQNLAFQLRTATSKQLDDLDLAVFTGNTVQLQGAAADLKSGIGDLKDLRTKIANIGNAFKEASTIFGYIDTAVAALSKIV